MSQVSLEKQKLVDETAKLLGEYNIIGAADLTKVGSGMLQDMRRLLRGQVLIKGIKNTLMEKAMIQAGLKDLRRIHHPNQGTKRLHIQQWQSL